MPGTVLRRIWYFFCTERQHKIVNSQPQGRIAFVTPHEWVFPNHPPPLYPFPGGKNWQVHYHKEAVFLMWFLVEWLNFWWDNRLLNMGITASILRCNCPLFVWSILLVWKYETDDHNREILTGKNSWLVRFIGTVRLWFYLNSTSIHLCQIKRWHVLRLDI